MLIQSIDKNKVEEAAVNFLRRYHTIVRVYRTMLADGIWQVDVLVSTPARRRLQVEVDSSTGNIPCF